MEGLKNKYINNGQTCSQGTREEKGQDQNIQTKDNTQKCKMHNGEPYKEKSSNLGPKPIINT
jgi:hypothetical protein